MNVREKRLDQIDLIPITVALEEVIGMAKLSAGSEAVSVKVGSFVEVIYNRDQEAIQMCENLLIKIKAQSHKVNHYG